MSDSALRMLETMIADPAAFDEGVETARNACAAGASIAAGAIAAAAYYDNPLTGVGALRGLMSRLCAVGNELSAWQQALSPSYHPETGDADFTPGFGFISAARAERTLLACRCLATLRHGRSAPRCRFMNTHQMPLSQLAGPLNETGLAALVYLDAGLDLDSAEQRWLTCKLSIAIGEAQRAKRAGIAAFPFSLGRYVYDGPQPPPASLDLGALKRQLGLDGSDG